MFGNKTQKLLNKNLFTRKKMVLLSMTNIHNYFLLGFICLEQFCYCSLKENFIDNKKKPPWIELIYTFTMIFFSRMLSSVYSIKLTEFH